MLDRAFHRLISAQVILVVHPRKEDPHAKLALTSIYGGAKAAQEADNVLILQAPLPPPPPGGAAAAPSANGPKWVDVVKNRYAGSLGSVMMAYSGPTCRYYELAAGQAVTALRQASKRWPGLLVTPTADASAVRLSDLAESKRGGARKQGGKESDKEVGSGDAERRRWPHTCFANLVLL